MLDSHKWAEKSRSVCVVPKKLAVNGVAIVSTLGAEGSEVVAPVASLAKVLGRTVAPLDLLIDPGAGVLGPDLV